MGRVKSMLIDAMETEHEFTCPDCDGLGEIEWVSYSRQSFDRDIGVENGSLEECATCEGAGHIYRECETYGCDTIITTDCTFEGRDSDFCTQCNEEYS